MANESSIRMDASLTGLTGVLRAIRDAGTNGRKALDKGTDAAAEIILERARELCPRLKGASPNVLVESLGKKKQKYRRGNVVLLMIGARTGFKTEVTLEDGSKFTEDPANIAHLVEFGTQPHSLGKGSSIRDKFQHGDIHPGAQEKPFLRPAWDERKTAAEQKFAAVAAEELAK